MKARRTSGFEIQPDSTGGGLPTRAALSLYPEALKKLPTGVLLLLLDDPADVRTFRVVDANPAAVESFGSVTLWCSARRSLTFLEFSKPQFPASCWLRSAAEKIATWANLHLETVRKKNTFTPSGYFLSPRIVSAWR